MRFFTEKKNTKKENIWFAWYPVWAFYSDSRMCMVWREEVKRIPLSSGGWLHNIIEVN